MSYHGFGALPAFNTAIPFTPTSNIPEPAPAPAPVMIGSVIPYVPTGPISHRAPSYTPVEAVSHKAPAYVPPSNQSLPGIDSMYIPGSKTLPGVEPPVKQSIVPPEEEGVYESNGGGAVVTADQFNQVCKMMGGSIGTGPCCAIPASATSTGGNLGLVNGQMVPVAACSSGVGGNIPLIAGAAIAAVLLMKVL